MNADEFLNRNQRALHEGDLQDRSTLHWALGGGDWAACEIAETAWLAALGSAPPEWLSHWPAVDSIRIAPDNLFAGGETLPQPVRPYTMYRLFKLPRVVPDSTAPADIETENLTARVEESVKLRNPLFVTDWPGPRHPDCCVAACMEMLGMGGKIAANETRVAVGLSISGSLFKPTWIDAGFWVYWMPNPNPKETWGNSRHLVTGRAGAREWVCRAEDVEVSYAHVIRATRSVDYTLASMSDEYWQACQDWVLAYRQQLAGQA